MGETEQKRTSGRWKCTECGAVMHHYDLGGYDCRCRACGKEFKRPTPEERRLAKNARQRAYRRENKDYYRDYARKYRELHREEFREYYRQYYAEHRDRILEIQHRHYVKNREELLFKTKKRRLRALEAQKEAAQ